MIYHRLNIQLYLLGFALHYNRSGFMWSSFTPLLFIALRFIERPVIDLDILIWISKE